MIYNEYTEGCKRLKGMQRALDRRFIREYRYRHLYGKVVFVRYHFRGKVRTEKHYFEGLEPFAILHEITPVFRKLEKDGKPGRKRVDNIYALSQIEEITLVKDNDDGRNIRTGKGNACSSTSVREDQGLAGPSRRKDAGETCRQDD